MIKNYTVLSKYSENYELKAKAMSYLRKQFLSMPYEDFVNINKLRGVLNIEPEISRHLINLNSYLDFGIDSYRYFMHLEDEKSAEVKDALVGHDIHTDMWGRINNSNAYSALQFAMGFSEFSNEIDVEELGLERYYGYAEETVSTELGDVEMFGYKNINGKFHGYGEIKQSDGAKQLCFFDNGRILARRIMYLNGMCEDVRDNDSLVVDPYVPRVIYELCSSTKVKEDDNIVFADNEMAVKQVHADRKIVEEIFNILGDYSLRVEYQHYVSYPYCDEDVLEIEKAERIPTINMAFIDDGHLGGVIFKTNGKTITALDNAGQTNRILDTMLVGLNQENVIQNYKITLRKKDEKGDSENEA